MNRAIDRLQPLNLEPVHNWFELSYAQYVALPRTILQSMPVEWQGKFVELMEELDESFDWRREGCQVKYRTRRGRYMEDTLGDYERGRRVLTSDQAENIVTEHNRRYES